MLREEEIMKRQEQPGLDQAKIRCLELHSGPPRTWQSPCSWATSANVSGPSVENWIASRAARACTSTHLGF